MRLTERRENGGKRKWRQIRQKISKEKSVKKRSPQKKKGDSRKRETGQTTVWKVWFYMSGRIYKIILSGLPAVGDGLFHSWSGRSCTAFRFRLKWTAKKKNRQKSVKAPLWHKRKRNGPCIISLNFCLGVRQSPFLRLCGSRHTFVQNLFGRWCADGQNRFYGKTYM